MEVRNALQLKYGNDLRWERGRFQRDSEVETIDFVNLNDVRK